MIRLKPGVRVMAVRPEFLLAVRAAEAAVEARGLAFVITSVTEGRHSKTSLHDAGAAFDFRSSGMTGDQVDDVAVELRSALGPDFDIVVEHDHFHVEFQPKG